MQRPQLITALISWHCLRHCRSCDKTLANVILTKPHRRLLKTRQGAKGSQGAQARQGRTANGSGQNRRPQWNILAKSTLVSFNYSNRAHAISGQMQFDASRFKWEWDCDWDWDWPCGCSGGSSDKWLDARTRWTDWWMDGCMAEWLTMDVLSSGSLSNE